MSYNPDNIFAKILKKEIPADIVLENDHVLAFKDIDPKAPVHILIIPKVEIATALDVDRSHDEYLGAMFVAAKEIAKKNNLAKSGYRLVVNCQEGAGQSVFHLHMHLIGGRTLHWPPG